MHGPVSERAGPCVRTSPEIGNLPETSDTLLLAAGGNTRRPVGYHRHDNRFLKAAYDASTRVPWPMPTDDPNFHPLMRLSRRRSRAYIGERRAGRLPSAGRTESTCAVM